MKYILVVIGTRPEAIKLAPLVMALQAEDKAFVVQILLSGQHHKAVEEVLDSFGIKADALLPPPPHPCSLAQLHAHLLCELEQAFLRYAAADMVLVQGDTTTALAAAQAAFYCHIPVGHVEAGLHTAQLDMPFPEEANRRQISRLTRYHFAPTPGAASYLQHIGIPASAILMTGNTGIDALQWILANNAHCPPPLTDYLPTAQPASPYGLITFHRRENQGERLELFCDGLRHLLADTRLHLYLPLHPNPKLQARLKKQLDDLPHLSLLPPLPYPVFVELMDKAFLLISDSGGIQEEATALGKPLLMLRDTTERPEGIDNGSTIPVSLTDGSLLREVSKLLQDEDYYRSKSKPQHTFGDGRASERIVAFLRYLT